MYLNVYDLFNECLLVVIVNNMFDCFYVDYIGKNMFFQHWCEACSSQICCFTKNNMCVFVDDRIVIFPFFSN